MDLEAAQWIVLKAGDDHFAFAVYENEVVASPVGGVMLDGVFPVEQPDSSNRYNGCSAKCEKDQTWVSSDHGNEIE